MSSSFAQILMCCWCLEGMGRDARPSLFEKKYLEEHPEEVKKILLYRKESIIGAPAIASFLNWPESRVIFGKSKLAYVLLFLFSPSTWEGQECVDGQAFRRINSSRRPAFFMDGQNSKF